MKVLRRNCITVYYALVDTETDTYDEYGNLTGSPTLTYKQPVRARMAFGVRNGGIVSTPHGLENSYRQMLITDDLHCPITDGTILWVNACPMNSDGEMTPHTHIVSGVFPSLNNIVYRLEEAVPETKVQFTT